MKQKFTKLIAESQFEFTPRFSERVMKRLKQSAHIENASSVLSEKLSRLFYWVNIPMAAALMILMLLFFLNIHRSGQSGKSTEAVTINEYVYDIYVSNN